MSHPARVFGAFIATRPTTPADHDNRPLGELTLSFVPLALVAEWTRCGETSDFIARFFAHDYDDHELAGSVLSTVVNELVENVVKFSSDKGVPARLVVREYPGWVTIVTSNVVTASQATTFGDTITRLVEGDPELLFAEQIAHPPETGSAGIGLIILRKDYGATVGVRIADSGGGAATVEVEVTIDNKEMGRP